jgi:hypothetical protein
MYGNLNLGSTNDSLDKEIPSTSDKTIPQVETDGLLVYSEKDVKTRVRKSIFVTVGICMFLALVGMSAAIINARDRKPDETMQIPDQEFRAKYGSPPAPGEEVNDGSGNDNNQNRDLYSYSCIEYPAFVAGHDLDDAVYACYDLVDMLGCYDGTISVTNYYQIVPGGNWYVQCQCFC